MPQFRFGANLTASMTDVLRFTLAMFTVLGLVHIAFGITWMPLAFIFQLLTYPFREAQPLRFVAAAWMIFKYTCFAGLMVRIESTWLVEYPHVQFWIRTIPFVLVAFYAYAGYVTKKWQEDSLTNMVHSMRHGDQEAYGNALEDWDAVRKMVPAFRISMVAGLLVAVLTLVAPSLFLNALTATLYNWMGLVQNVPVLPLLLVVYGILWILNFFRIAANSVAAARA